MVRVEGVWEDKKRVEDGRLEMRQAPGGLSGVEMRDSVASGGETSSGGTSGDKAV